MQIFELELTPIPGHQSWLICLDIESSYEGYLLVWTTNMSWRMCVIAKQMQTIRGCWWPGDAMSQGISNLDIDLVKLN